MTTVDAPEKQPRLFKVCSHFRVYIHVIIYIRYRMGHGHLWVHERESLNGQPRLVILLTSDTYPLVPIY